MFCASSQLFCCCFSPIQWLQNPLLPASQSLVNIARTGFFRRRGAPIGVCGDWGRPSWSLPQTPVSYASPGLDSSLHSIREMSTPLSSLGLSSVCPSTGHCLSNIAQWSSTSPAINYPSSYSISTVDCHLHPLPLTYQADPHF